MKIDTVTIYGYSAILAIAFLWGAFVAYKKAIEAHLDDVHVLDTIVLAGFWSFVLSRLSYVMLNLGLFWGNWPRILFLKNYPGLDHWGLLLGVVVSIMIVTRNYRQKFYDWFDLAMLGMVAGMSVYFAGMAIASLSLLSIGGSLTSLGMFIFLWRAEKVYRTYSWYKNKKTQAKSGFLSGVALSYYGLTHFILLVLSPGARLWVMIVNLLLFVGGFVMVYSRSGRSLSEDLKFKLRHGRKKD
ncbi:MAG: hypothetical protein UW99_C0026G0008 [Candidatus Collierbacteria bacterium GW2011_GWC2_45_15]|uniref:Prolipoprotein diacylglyceryl transferase n=3 Tax=Candidatus Collieribacteriota TaxID=1752725 RepID=A0A0G1P6P5_9BACT|nr:MAG: hypothetical protein UW23_C0026G0009 [Candidatus Collierbacteria bacterium GW2011_GWA1_44_12]KKT98114.1 MAG: hypothetical protein UW99_C0026G0008 [Candidatus Collierbacteria bacterium GW2011_GWC2_45_15]KKU28564.1 MAG: hypothetical protein UX41_C0032G0008 [Candidatus Collierbacteria bacterium GW2011_GWE1_46_18]